MNTLCLLSLALVGCTSTALTGEATWTIDAQQRMIWQGNPYLPFNSFATSNLDAAPTAADRHLWIDDDPGNPAGDPATLDHMTGVFEEHGETYTALLLTMNPPDNNAGRLFDEAVKSQIVDSWRPFAPALQKSGLRAIVLFNEINIDWSWPASHTVEQYGQVLADYASEARLLFGDVPILFKVVPFGHLDGEGNASNVIAAVGHDSVAGIGVDHYSSSCGDVDRFDEVRLVIADVLALNPNRVIWATEFGSSAPRGPVGTSACYWDEYPPFSDSSDMQCQLSALIAAGVTGFTLAAPEAGVLPDPCSHLDYGPNVDWFLGYQSTARQAILAR